MKVAALVVGAFVLLVAGGVALYLVAQSYTSGRTDATKDDEGRSPASYFKTGDCFKELPKTASSVTVVDCQEPHSAEVIAVFMLPDGDFPGEAAVEEYKRRCDPALADYAPDAVDDPAVRVLKRFPDEASWDIGDRSVTCIASFDSPRTGSLAG